MLQQYNLNQKVCRYTRIDLIILYLKDKDWVWHKVHYNLQTSPERIICKGPVLSVSNPMWMLQQNNLKTQNKFADTPESV